jgi:hypothetical protein
LVGVGESNGRSGKTVNHPTAVPFRLAEIAKLVEIMSLLDSACLTHPTKLVDAYRQFLILCSKALKDHLLRDRLVRLVARGREFTD